MARETSEHSDEVYIDLADIVLEPARLMRAQADHEAVEEFRLSLSTMPAVMIGVLPNGEHLLLDGWHRLQAVERAGKSQIKARLTQVDSMAEAFELACDEARSEAQMFRAVRFTSADKRARVQAALADPVIQTWSDHRIGNLCGCDHKTVAKYRAGDSATGEFPQSGDRKRIGSDGVARSVPQRVRSSAEDFPTDPDPRPEDSSQEVPETTNGVPGPHSVDAAGNPIPDPPEIAQARRKGNLEPGVTPVVQKGDLTASDHDDDVGERDPSDEEFLNACPVRAKLSAGLLRDRFDVDALSYRRLESARAKFKDAAKYVLADVRRKRVPFPLYTFAMNNFLKYPHPKQWLLCPHPDHGGCGGTSQRPVIGGDCQKCKGRGYIR